MYPLQQSEQYGMHVIWRKRPREYDGLELSENGRAFDTVQLAQAFIRAISWATIDQVGKFAEGSIVTETWAEAAVVTTRTKVKEWLVSLTKCIFAIDYVLGGVDWLTVDTPDANIVDK